LTTAITAGLEPRLEGRAATQGPSLVAAAIAVAATLLWRLVSGRQAALFLVGALAGVVLYHAAFGFTSAWRVLIVERRGAGLRAQMLMFAISCIFFFPLLAAGSVFGQAIRGAVAPAGVSVAFGALIFGVGMQLAGGCASGTLYTVGGGSTRMLVVLVAFVAGSVLGTAHAPWWGSLPAWAPQSLVAIWGPGLALAASLFLFAAISLASVVLERARYGRLEPERGSNTRWLRGPWPLAVGAVGLSLVNVATLVLAGRPWGVTSAFALWGAKLLSAAGVPVETWAYWSTPAQAAAFRASVAADVTSVMDVGVMLGALLAAFLAGRFAPVWRVPWRSLAAAVLGGILLGYGARAAHGCNIGACFSGIASGSLHGWLWLLAAFVGNAIGTRLRPLFGLSVERPRERGTVS
jgi:uncharacterized membrane protein YedE/YeeE